MKILHICLASHFTDGMNYQDNLLALQNKADGHDVTIISDCKKYINGHLKDTPEEDTILESGIRLIRVRFEKIINATISEKIRKSKKVPTLINEIKPEVILFHGAGGWELLSVAKYKEKNRGVKVFVDSHADYNNSAKHPISKLLQHLIFNRIIIRLSRKSVEKFLYVSPECGTFLKEMYGLKEPEIEFYPLGGFIVEKEEKIKNSKEIRARHGILEDDIVVVHTGKLDEGKRTKEVIDALSEIESKQIKLLIVGSIPENQNPTLIEKIQADSRIIYAGWKSSDELIKYLCAGDLYIQPGTQSATLQNAICCGLPIAIYPHASHIPYMKSNGEFIRTKEDIIEVINKIKNGSIEKHTAGEASYRIARQILDYRVLAERIY